MKYTKIALGTVLASCSLFMGAAAAEADTMLVLIDRSGSMNSPRDNSDGNGATRFDAAKYLALNSVAAVAAGRRYGLWTFNGFAYQEVVSLDPLADPIDTQVQVLAAIGGLPAPNSSTPLAMTMCDAVDALLPYFVPAPPPGSGLPDERPRIELFSDGLENSSSGPCAGTDWRDKVVWKAQTGSHLPPTTPPPPFAQVIVNADFLFEHEDTISTFAGFAAPHRKRGVKPEKSPVLEALQLEPVRIEPWVKVNPNQLLIQQFDFYTQITKATQGALRSFADSERLPQLGDMTGDFCVDQDDYNILIQNWNSSVPRKSALDPNGDGLVNLDDYLTLIQNWGEGC